MSGALLTVYCTRYLVPFVTVPCAVDSAVVLLALLVAVVDVVVQPLLVQAALVKSVVVIKPVPRALVSEPARTVTVLVVVLALSSAVPPVF